MVGGTADVGKIRRCLGFRDNPIDEALRKKVIED